MTEVVSPQIVEAVTIILILLGCLGALVSKIMTRKDTTSKIEHADAITLASALVDLFADLVYVAFLKHNGFTSEFYAFLVFLVVPAIANFVFVARLLLIREFPNKAFAIW